jgi:hypothetical protein
MRLRELAVEPTRRAATKAAHRRIAYCLKEEYGAHMKLPVPERIVSLLAQTDDGGRMTMPRPDDEAPGESTPDGGVHH